MKEFYYVGVDPGKSGAIVVVDHNLVIVDEFKMPDHLWQLVEIATGYRESYWMIEKVGPFFGASAKSSFTFGYGAGQLEGVLSALQIKFAMVPPRNWQKAMLEGVAGSIPPKERAYRAACRLFPGHSWPMVGKKPHDGIVDAALIAAYAIKGV